MPVLDRSPEEIEELLRRLELQRKELEESQAFLQTVIDSIPDPMLVIDRDHRTVLANRAAREMAGEADPVSRCLTCYWLAHQRDLPCADQNQPCPLQQVVASRAPTTVTHTRHGIDGQETFIEVVAAPVLSKSGEVAHIIETRRDITERQRAAQILRRSEERLRLVLRSADTAWWEWDLTSGVLLADERCNALLGLPPTAEPSRELLFQRVHPEDHLLVQKGLEEARARPGDYESEFRVIWPDGSVHWLLSKGRSIHDGEHRQVRLMGVVTDVTHRKSLEEALRESERRFAAFMRHLPAAAWIKDLEGRYVYANPEAERIFSTPLPTLLGKTDEEIFPPATARQFRENDRRALTEGGFVQTLEVLRQADGHDHYSLVSKFGVPGNGHPAYVAGVAFDITDHRRAEEALRESQDRLRLCLESAELGWWSWDFAAGAIEGDNKTKSLLGSPDATLPFAGIPEYTHPDDRSWLQERTMELQSRAGDYEVEFRVVWPDGSIHWILTRGRSFGDVGGKPVRAAGIAMDITDRKRAEQEVAAARASAEQANRAKDHFLAVLSHELRTPLTPVVMAVSMLQDRPDIAPEIRETLEMVRRNVEMEAQLIDDLLDVTRIARGKVELTCRSVELCTVIHRAVEVCKPDIEARGLHLHVDLGPAAPYWVEADISRLQQVFWNLLNNAIKFTPHDGRVDVRCRPQDAHVLAEVQDSGIGIEPDALPRIFDAFEQAERSITRRFGGLGLGLAISKALVEMHGGTISAHSEGRDKGATFRIRLPLTAPAGQPQAPAPVALPQRTVRPLRILLVEDHGVTAKMTRLVLCSDGHSVATAGDLTTALELAGQQAFDLLISDLGLPDGSGHELMRRLRERGQTLPGIALSGYGQEEDIRRSYEAGFAAHLTKPTSRERLVEAIASVTAAQPDLA